LGEFGYSARGLELSLLADAVELVVVEDIEEDVNDWREDD
jgi:hypothetical protein